MWLEKKRGERIRRFTITVAMYRLGYDCINMAINSCSDFFFLVVSAFFMNFLWMVALLSESSCLYELIILEYNLLNCLSEDENELSEDLLPS